MNKWLKYIGIGAAFMIVSGVGGFLLGHYIFAPAPTSTPTPTPTPAGLSPQIASGRELPQPYESEGGVPYNGNSITFDVAPGEVEVYTCGPATIAGITLSGGENRGSVIIMLPAENKVVTYTITNVLPGSGWHGAYRFDREVNADDWKRLVDDRVAAMRAPLNCTSGKGCQTVDVIVVGPGPSVISRETR